MRILVLLGAPGAGKGTQAHVLARHLALPRVATGDLFRAAARDGTPLGIAAQAYMERGELVPDEITIGMLLERLEAPDAGRGVILDGFPRNRPQADALDRALADRGAAVDAALLVDVPADELLRRLTGRWLCSAAGHTYHETAYPPRVPGVCDIDGSALVQRDDDRPEVVQARLDKQLGALADVVEHYRAAGLLRTVDGRRPIAAVTSDLLDAIEPIPYWRSHP
ncbi:MAG: adenylate kinase [Candidatus Limnocylindrales bacterium]|jgi:adenylate kinase|nr:adenylate kinase [Candidatus Limnocylindrales bacterium]